MLQGNYRPPTSIETWTLRVVVAVAGAPRDFISVGIKQASSHQQGLVIFRNVLAATATARYPPLITSSIHITVCRLEGLNPTGISLFRHHYGAAMNAS